MKGLIVDNNGQLQLHSDLEMPSPLEGEIMVKIMCASVNPYDAESVEGRWDPYFKEYNVDKQVQTGLEFSGILLEDGKLLKKGEQVFGYVHMITGWKTHAEYIAINENYLAKMPTNTSFTEAAALPLGALTSLIAIRDIGRLENGMSLLINGAAGGLGSLGIQVGKILGAKVTAVAGAHKEDYLLALGADKIYDYNQQQITEIGGKFDVIIDLTSKIKFREALEILAPNGIFIPAEADDENGGTSESKNVGYLLVMHGDFDNLSLISQWVEQGKLRPVVDSTFPFSEYHKAFKRIKSKGRAGRVVLSWES